MSKNFIKKNGGRKNKNLVGFDLKFEKPLNYDLKINTKKNKTSAAVVSVINKLIQKELIKNYLLIINKIKQYRLFITITDLILKSKNINIFI